MLIQYVRDKNRQKVGVLVALSKNNIGWSKCNKVDHFDKDRGLHIAIMRAKMYNLDEVIPNVAESMSIHFIRMMNRARRYFK